MVLQPGVTSKPPLPKKLEKNSPKNCEKMLYSDSLQDEFESAIEEINASKENENKGGKTYGYLEYSNKLELTSNSLDFSDTKSSKYVENNFNNKTGTEIITYYETSFKKNGKIEANANSLPLIIVSDTNDYDYNSSNAKTKTENAERSDTINQKWMSIDSLNDIEVMQSEETTNNILDDLKQKSLKYSNNESDVHIFECGDLKNKYKTLTINNTKEEDTVQKLENQTDYSKIINNKSKDKTIESTQKPCSKKLLKIEKPKPKLSKGKFEAIPVRHYKEYSEEKRIDIDSWMSKIVDSESERSSSSKSQRSSIEEKKQSQKGTNNYTDCLKCIEHLDEVKPNEFIHGFNDKEFLDNDKSSEGTICDDITSIIQVLEAEDKKSRNIFY